MRSKLLFILAILFLIGGFGCVVYAGVMQMILCYQKFGAIITENLFIPHWSAWFYFGAVPMITGYVMLYLGE